MSDALLDLFLTLGFFVIGLSMGSFACCQAWRIYYRGKHQKLGSRSVCLHCKYQLKWYDNIPLLSWLILRGRCRKCQKPIGKAEIFSELTLGLSFTAVAFHFFTSSNFSAVVILQFILLLCMLVSFWILLVYDAKWQRLPVGILYLSIGLALVYAVCTLCQAPDFWTATLNLVGAIGLLSGTYFLLYLFSKESLVGGGDWLLCLSIALVLGHWWLAIIELFLANLLASVATLPAFVKKGQKKLALGPFLILAFVVTYLCQTWLLSFI